MGCAWFGHEREEGDRNDVRMRVARRFAEGAQLLEVNVVQPGLDEQLARGRRLPRVADAHEAARKCPLARERPGFHLDQKCLQVARGDRKDHDVDGYAGRTHVGSSERRRQALSVSLLSLLSLRSLRSCQDSSSMRRSERSAPRRTSSSRTISCSICCKERSVPSSVIIFMNWQSLQAL